MSNENVENFVDGLIAIFKAFEEINESDFVKKKFGITKCDLNLYGNILTCLGQDVNRLRYNSYFANQDLQHNLTKALEKKIPEAQFFIDDFYSLKGLMKLNANFDDYQVIAQRLSDRLYNFQATVPEIEQLLSSLLLLYIYNDNYIVERLKKFVATGRLFIYFEEAIKQGKVREIALCVLIALLNYTSQIAIDFPQTPQRNKANSGWQKFQRIFDQEFYNGNDFWVHFLEIINQSHITYEKLFVVLSQSNSNEVGVKIFQGIIKKLFTLNKENAIHELSSFVLEHNSFIRECLKDDENTFNEYVKRSIRIRSLGRVIQDIEYGCDDLDHRSFAERIFSLNLRTKTFARWVYSSLDKLDKNGWESLIKNSWQTSIVVERLSTIYNLRFSNHLRDALEAIGAELVVASEEPNLDPKRIQRYGRGLDEDAFLLFKKNIIDQLIDNANANLVFFLKYFSEHLRDRDLLKKKIVDFYNRFVMVKIEKGSVEELEWLVDTVGKSRLYDERNKLVKSVKKAVREKIEDIQKQPDLESDRKRVLRKLREYC
ncbi:MAG: hypothetical protein WBB67_10130 [bacterium]